MESYEEKYRLKCKELKLSGLVNEELNKYENFKDSLTEDEFKLCMRKKHNRANKRYRVKEKYLTLYRIKAVLNHNNKKVVFGTITLDDKALSRKEDTYIRKIDSWLKKHFIYSILNKDFGSRTEREHYHFIGLTTEDIELTGKKSYKGYDLYELKIKDYPIGFEPDLELIDDEFNDITKAVNYLLKLNNHSNKLGTKSRVRIIKNHQAEMIMLTYNMNRKKALKKATKSFYEKLKGLSKNPTYDELNKMSSSSKVLSDEEFVMFLEGKLKYTEL